ncbi:MAG: A24 family peptidase [Polyangiaceae bacterium]
MSIADLYFMIAAAIVAGVAAWTDYRTGHIPNWLTLGALAVAPVAHFAVKFATTGSLDEAIVGAGFSLIGACVVGLVPVVLYRMGGTYGGDVKLLAAIGAICGTRLGIEAELFAFIVGSAFALGRLAYQGKLLRTLGNSFRLVFNPLLPKDKRVEVVPEMMTEIRFGPAIFVGVVGAVFMQWRPM